MHFGSTLRLLRTSAGVSLSGLAAHVGVSPAYLSRVEHGHDAPPTPDRLRAIAVALALPPDRLLDLVDALRPDAIAWLGHSPEGRQLAAELRRRQLTAGQIARVIQFVRREFPSAAGAEPFAADPFGAALDPRRVLLGVGVAAVRDALDIAALRLVDGAGAADVAQALLAQERAGTGAVGGGLLLAHAPAPFADVRACLLVLATPLPLPTPDGLPVRIVLAFAGPRNALTEYLVEASTLAEAGLVERLAAAAASEEVIAMIRGERRGMGGSGEGQEAR